MSRWLRVCIHVVVLSRLLFVFRYLGDIYSRSTMPHVKDLILCEAVARAIKVVLNHSLRKQSRYARAQTLMAEQRKRSKAENYIQHQGTVLKNKVEVFVDMYNVVFGRGPATDEFWAGAKSKFHGVYCFHGRIPRYIYTLLHTS